MNDLVDGVRIVGNVRIGGTDIYDRTVDVTELRKRVGMVFQKSNPFPKTIFENVAYGPRILGREEPERSRGHRGAEPARGAPSGTRSATGCTRARWGCPAASSSACASRGPSRWSRTCS